MTIKEQCTAGNKLLKDFRKSVKNHKRISEEELYAEFASSISRDRFDLILYILCDSGLGEVSKEAGNGQILRENNFLVWDN